MGKNKLYPSDKAISSPSPISMRLAGVFGSIFFFLLWRAGRDMSICIFPLSLFFMQPLAPQKTPIGHRIFGQQLNYRNVTPTHSGFLMFYLARAPCALPRSGFRQQATGCVLRFFDCSRLGRRPPESLLFIIVVKPLAYIVFT